MATLFNRGKNQLVRLATGDPADQGNPDDQTPDVVLFTPEQFTTLVAALKLEGEPTPDDVVAAVTALAEQADKTVEQVTEEVAASAVHPQGVTIDQHVWRDMKRAVERGLAIDKQEHRLAAEQTVDQAIRLGKASPTKREDWIAAYQADPETTIHRLNRGQEIPRMEIGYGLQPRDDDGQEPAGWVR